MEHLHPEGAAGLSQQRAVRSEPDVAVAVIVQLGQGVRQRRHGRVVGDRCQFARPAHDIVITEAGGGSRTGGGRRLACGGLGEGR